MVYGMAWWASHGMCIGLARCGMVCYCLMGYGIVYGMAYTAWPSKVWHGIWYGLVGMDGIWYGLARFGMVYNMPAGHSMAYGMA